jgi:lipopolysaccharide export system permease protein
MAVLLVIFMSSQFADTLSDAAADELPRDAVFEVFGLQFLQTLGLVAPAGLLLGILLALARLNRDSEMAALAACGIGPVSLLRPIGVLSLLLAVGVGWLSLLAGPAANRSIEEISFRSQQQLQFDALQPGTFTQLDSSGSIFYAHEADGDVRRGVFLQREIGDELEIIVAEEGERTIDEDSDSASMEFRNGHRYVGVPGEYGWVIASFVKQVLPIPVDERVFEPAIESLPTLSLLGSTDPQEQAELHWRIAVPLSILILALVAVPLGRASPREGKYARVGIGLLIYIIYANSLSIARVWIERGAVPDWLGMWWVHAALGTLGIVILAQQSLGFGRRGEP